MDEKKLAEKIAEITRKPTPGTYSLAHSMRKKMRKKVEQRLGLQKQK